MISRTAAVEQQLMAGITDGSWPAGSPIPSRNRLAAKLKCSRTTVERAVAELTRRGYLVSRKGSGTRVLSAHPRREIRELMAVINSTKWDYRRLIHMMFPDGEFEGLPVRWIFADAAVANTGLLTAPGRAVVWMMPHYGLILLMEHLRCCGVPQVIINRDFEHYDRICIDQAASIRDGLSWLMIEAGRDVAVVAYHPNSIYPYMAPRIIAFYQEAMALGAKLYADRIFYVEPHDIQRGIGDVARQLWSGSRFPHGVFAVNGVLAAPLVAAARAYGVQPGRDYRLLGFDAPVDDQLGAGMAIMRSRYDAYRLELAKWLRNGGTDPEHPFVSEIRTELLIGGR